MDNGVLLGRVRGIEVRVNWSVLVIVGLVAWSLAESLLPEFAEGYRTGEYWAVAGVLAVALMAALLAHELGHSIVAAREGVEVASITLWMFGGVARLVSSPTDPRTGARIAIAGPAVSIGIGIVAVAFSAVATTDLAAAAFGWFGAINILLALFNLLPAFPMDGGRLYQAWLWQKSGNELEATQKAAATGHTIGGALIILGLLEALLAGAIGGLWLVMIGWFVREAARAEVERATIMQPFRALSVTQLMTPAPITVTEATTVDDFVSDVIFGGRHAAYPVLGADGSLRGLVTLRDIRGLDRGRWESTTIGELATPLADVPTVDATATAADLLEVIGYVGEQRALVLAGDRLVGIISPSDVARLVAAIELAGPEAFATDSARQPTPG